MRSNTDINTGGPVEAVPVTAWSAAAPADIAANSMTMLAVPAGLLLPLLLHYRTLAAMVDIWLHSQTFAHGAVIAPISGWLVWRQRRRLSAIAWRPSPAALAILAVLGAAWLMASLATVPVLQEYLVVAMLPATVAALLGGATARAIAFPLAYLLLAVPFGEVFVPPLIDFTASFVVGALQLSGIPAYRDHNFISLSSGNWSVVDACSGLRYVIASFALGTLYAYLNYRSAWRRLAFIVVALVVPVFANGLRAYGIVLLGHWSDMRLAVGVDHLIYGWVFFCLISLLLFWCGGRWRDQLPLASAEAGKTGKAGEIGKVDELGKAGEIGKAGELANVAAPGPGRRRAWTWRTMHASITAIIGRPAAARAPSPRIPGLPLALLGCTAISAAFPLLAAAIRFADQVPDSAAAPPALTLVALPLPWRSSPMTDDDWQVLHAGQPQRYAAKLSNGSARITLQLNWYTHQDQQGELLTPMRRSIQAGQPQWQEMAGSVRRVQVGGRSMAIRENVVQAGTTKLLIWRWYRQGGVDTASAFEIKLRLAAAKLLRRRQDGADIVLAAPFDEQADSAVAVLRPALAAVLPAIDDELSHLAPR